MKTNHTRPYGPDDVRETARILHDAYCGDTPFEHCGGYCTGRADTILTRLARRGRLTPVEVTV